MMHSLGIVSWKENNWSTSHSKYTNIYVWWQSDFSILICFCNWIIKRVQFWRVKGFLQFLFPFLHLPCVLQPFVFNLFRVCIVWTCSCFQVLVQAFTSTALKVKWINCCLQNALSLLYHEWKHIGLHLGVW